MIAALSISVLLVGCYPGEPAVHVAYQRDLNKKFDFACIDEALGAVASDVRRQTYQSNGIGSQGFASGIVVTYFTYSDPAELGSYSLHVAIQPNGITHYWHQWGKMGTSITAAEQDAVLPLLTQADRSVAGFCGLSFSDTTPLVGHG